MINPKNNGNALGLAVSIAATLTNNKRILMSRFPNSPVNTVQASLRPTTMDLTAGMHDELSVDFINEVNAKFLEHNQEHDALQEGEFRDLVQLVAGGIKATLARAREKAVPVIKAGVAFLNGAPNGELGSNISITENAYNPLHDELANSVVADYDDKALSSTYGSVILNTTQLSNWREGILNANGEYDPSTIQAWFETLTDDDFAAVVIALFSNTEISVGSSELFSRRYYSGLDQRLLAYLTVCWLETNPVAGSGVSLAEWEVLFRRLHVMTGVALARSYKDRALDRSRGLLVLDHSSLGGKFGEAYLSVMVNPDVYGSYLADGDANDKIEAILGSTLTHTGLITIGFLDEGRPALVKGWQNHVTDHRTNYINQRLRRTRESLRMFILGMEGVPTDVRETLLQSTGWRDRMETSLLRIDADLLNNPWRMVGDLVCDVMFDEQLKALLQSMREIGESMPNATPREVAAIAANRALGIWLAGQVSVFTFDPTRPDDQNY